VREEYGWVQGHVYDSVTSEAIQGATVTCAGKSAETDVTGFFRIENIEPGIYKITAQAEGYIPESQDIEVKAGLGTNVIFYLEPSD